MQAVRSSLPGNLWLDAQSRSQNWHRTTRRLAQRPSTPGVQFVQLRISCKRATVATGADRGRDDLSEAMEREVVLKYGCELPLKSVGVDHLVVVVIGWIAADKKGTDFAVEADRFGVHI
jgi:hypothetical protein